MTKTGVPPPALPKPEGPNPARARFFLELAGALEFLALYHSLPADSQRQAREFVSELASKAIRP